MVRVPAATRISHATSVPQENVPNDVGCSEPLIDARQVVPSTRICRVSSEPSCIWATTISGLSSSMWITVVRPDITCVPELPFHEALEPLMYSRSSDLGYFVLAEVLPPSIRTWK